MTCASHLGMREVAVAIVYRLNLLPSIATLGVCNGPTFRHSATDYAQILWIAAPLSLRKSAIVL
jgi:hypothetical protein